MKIILIRPNYKSHIITPPLGIGYIASYLKGDNIDVKIIDGLRDNISNNDMVKMVKAECPDVVGITCLTAFYKDVVDLSLKLKKENIRVVIGGIHPTFLPFETLKESQCDYVILGEGELSFKKLLQNNFDNNNIPGIYTIENFSDKNFKSEYSEQIVDLDNLPFPDWEQINPNLYPKAPTGAIVKHFPIGEITTTRGCPYKCTFCASPSFYKQKIRFRSPSNVVNEIKYLIEKFKIREIHFQDDNLTLNHDHIREICNLILNENIKISWACANGIRADKVDEDLLKLMKKSGCYLVKFGIESSDKQILKNIQKHTDINIIEKAIISAKNAGISTQGFFIFGLPGETTKTIKETIKFAKKSKLDRAQFTILDILPGSKLWDSLRGQFIPNWSKNSYKEPEWITEGLTKKQLMKSQSLAFREFYFKSPIRLYNLLLQIRFGQIKYIFRRIIEYRLLFGYRSSD